MYYYFKDKEDLIASAMDYVTKLFTAELENLEIDESWSHGKLYKTFLRTMYNSNYKYQKYSLDYREFFFLSSHYVSRESYRRVVYVITLPPKYAFEQIFAKSKTIQILGYDNWELISRTITDFALN